MEQYIILTNLCLIYLNCLYPVELSSRNLMNFIFECLLFFMTMHINLKNCFESKGSL